MKKINFIFIHSSHDILLFHSLINQNYINKTNLKLFVFNTYDKQYKLMLSEYKDIIYLEGKSILKKIKYFNIINKEISKFKKNNNEINFFASDYLNFISNYFFRQNYIKKNLLSHGNSNYIDKYNSDHDAKNFYRKNILILRFFKIYDKIYFRLRQSLLLLMCFKIYDPFFLHNSGADKIKFDNGFFYSLENLYTKTKNDILLKFPSLKFINLPNQDYILFIENFNSPSYNYSNTRKLIEEKLNSINCDTIIHKPHLNLLGKKIKKLKTKKKVIVVDPRIPAEFYIPPHRKVHLLGSESSVMIHAKIINKKNIVICYDNIFKVDKIYRNIYLKYSIDIIDVN